MGGSTYRTVAGQGEAAFEVRGSEFIGYAAPAESIDTAEAFVERINERHPDATHNVPAYRVRASSAGADRFSSGGGFLREYSSDDGEPSGSAGKPSLNVLQQRDVENAIVVVTRYYGGTNLGVGGLVRSYSRAVKEAVDDAGIVEERPHERLRIRVTYDDSGTVRGILESEAVEFEAEYGEDVSFTVRIPVEETDALCDRLRSATSGRAEIDAAG
ncbi:IMPACT family protein [Haladaptatus caseinilyticus]|uniref:IMPACT family protein n=1 Tax=Haladaptatus caseinilyticus TaxID=2993314 RepID=UPI00224B4831|nr:YigZ family protein [Haladaptatus caseinilyticus]